MDRLKRLIYLLIWAVIAVCLVVVFGHDAAQAGDRIDSTVSRAPLPPGIAAQVVLIDTPFARSDTIYLSDIAAIHTDDSQLRAQLEQVPVGKAALPGRSRELNVNTLRLRLRQARLPVHAIEIVSDQDMISVPTRYQIVSSSDLIGAVEQSYRQAFELNDDMTLSIEAVADEERVPLGPVQLETMSVPRLGRGRIPVDIWVADTRYKRVYVQVHAILEMDVPILARDVARGEPIGPGDIITERRNVEEQAIVVARLDEGWRAKRALRSGTALTWSMIEPVPDLVKGDVVTLVAKVGPVTVKALARAEDDGWFGDQVRVRNLSTGEVVTGTFNSEFTVLVNR